MWKRRRTWLTVALLIWLNIVAWDIRTATREQAGVISLYQHQVEVGIEYTILRPARFYFDSVWYSYAVALFVGFVLPFILARLLPWLWRRKQSLVWPVRRLLDISKTNPVAFWLALLVVLNVMVWGVLSILYEMSFGTPLYREARMLEYLGVMPSLRINGWPASLLIGVGLPAALFWVLSRRKKHPGIGWAEVTGIRTLPLNRSVVAFVAVLVVFNILAWDWVESANKGEISLVLGQRENPEMSGWSYGLLYYGITPGVLVHSENVSWALSLFVGEILPFVLLPALLRRRRPSVLPLPPVAGAPR